MSKVVVPIDTSMFHCQRGIKLDAIKVTSIEKEIENFAKFLMFKIFASIYMMYISMFTMLGLMTSFQCAQDMQFLELDV